MKRVLIIDDDLNLLNGICLVLQMEGYEVENAVNGYAGLQKTLNFAPDLVLCDLMLPELDGYAVLAALRFNPVTASIPFVFITAAHNALNSNLLKRLGVHRCILKPFDVSFLIDTVRSEIAHPIQPQHLLLIS